MEEGIEWREGGMGGGRGRWRDGRRKGAMEGWKKEGGDGGRKEEGSDGGRKGAMEGWREGRKE